MKFAISSDPKARNEALIHFKMKTNLSLFLLLLCLSSCSRSSDPGPNDFHENGSDPPTNRIDIPSTVRSNLGITFAKVERRTVATTIRVPGSFELQPRAKFEYRPLLSGQVEFLVDELDEVKRGMVLYRFRSSEWLELQSDIDLASASLSQARLRLQAVTKRAETLETANLRRVDLELEREEARAQLRKREVELELSVNRAVRVLNLQSASSQDGVTVERLLALVERDGRRVPFYQSIEFFEVRAAQAGFVETLAVANGSYVEEATLLLTTVDPQKVRFRALGMQNDLPVFNRVNQARIVPLQRAGSNLNESVDAKFQLGLSADPQARTVTLFAEPNGILTWIRPGVSAFLEVADESTGGFVLAIPRSAVVKDGITQVFFKRDPNDANRAIRVEADLGVDDGRWIEVKSEVGPNDEVVLDGAFELKLATAQSGTTQKGGHFHADGTFHADDH